MQFKNHLEYNKMKFSDIINFNESQLLLRISQIVLDKVRSYANLKRS
jgi:hypothetical protein